MRNKRKRKKDLFAGFPTSLLGIGMLYGLVFGIQRMGMASKGFENRFLYSINRFTISVLIAYLVLFLTDILKNINK